MLTYEFDSFVKDILCVLVIYKTKLVKSESFCSIYKSFKKKETNLDFFIYDNSPEPYYHSSKSDFPDFNIYYVHDQLNPGVSMAYNKGYEFAKRNSKKWLLFIDQDTIFPEGILESYYLSIINNPEINLFVPKLMQNKHLLSPCKYFLKRGSSLSNIKSGKHKFKKLSVLNSGLFVSVLAFKQVGGYNEKIKLDFADYYFIDHFKTHFDSFIVIDSICLHELSSTEEDFNKVLNRFNFYCNGAKNYSRNISAYCNLLLLSLIRAIKLSLKFRKIEFMKSFINYFLGNSIV